MQPSEGLRRRGNTVAMPEDTPTPVEKPKRTKGERALCMCGYAGMVFLAAFFVCAGLGAPETTSQTALSSGPRPCQPPPFPTDAPPPPAPPRLWLLLVHRRICDRTILHLQPQRSDAQLGALL